MHDAKTLKFHTPIILVHIPRCAGTSVAMAIRSTLKLSDTGRIDPIRVRKSAELIIGSENPEKFFELYPLLQQYLLAYILYEELVLVSGHLPVGSNILEKHAATCSFITVLRDPVERWISHYIYNKLVNSDPLVPPTNTCKSHPLKELESVIGDRRGWQLGHLITTMLSGQLSSPEHSNVSVNLANNNLRHFSLIGFVENLPTFEKKLEEFLGVQLTIPHNNSLQSVAEDSVWLDELRSMFKKKIRRRIASLCEDDYKVYEKARSLFL